MAKHYLQNDRLHLKRRAARSEARNFIEAAIYFDQSECLIWPFGRTTDGYAAYRSRHAAQYICESVYGEKPIGNQTAHSCGDRLCVNPKHLRWSTPRENSLDKLDHGTWPRGLKNGRSMISEDQVREIRYLAGKVSYKKMAKDFGISKSAIEAIVNRKNWSYLK
jgi:HNH endonuclease